MTHGERSAEAVRRLRVFLAQAGLPGMVATRPGTVAWVTGGMNPPIDRTAATDVLWAVVTGEGAWLVTTEVERDRIAAEYRPREAGFELLAVPWSVPGDFVRAARTVCSDAGLAADGHPGFAVDASDRLTALRMALSAADQEELRGLGADTAAALEGALRSWRPGDSDRSVQARIAAAIEERGADAPVLIVGGDDRLRRYRHPLAAGAPVHQVVMAVAVARRGGLHVAATRFATAGPPPPELAAGLRSCARIEAAVLGAARPGTTYGDLLDVLDGAYTAEGHPGAWRQHYQGGPIGYAQREFEIAPGQRDSAFSGLPVEVGHALAWNPSLPGGAKVENTYLITTDGLEQVTGGGSAVIDIEAIDHHEKERI